MIEDLELILREITAVVQCSAGAAAVVAKKQLFLEKTVPNWLERLETQGFGRRLG